MADDYITAAVHNDPDHVWSTVYERVLISFTTILQAQIIYYQHMETTIIFPP